MVNSINDVREFFNSISLKHEEFKFNIRNLVWHTTLWSVRDIANNYSIEEIKNRITIKKRIQNFEIENIFGYTVFPSVRRATKHYSDIIEEFKKTLELHFEPEDLKLLHKNVNNLLIKKNRLNKTISGEYINGMNIIVLAKDNSLYHELFHMASSHADVYEGYFWSGLDYNDGIDKFGEAINEGYTELMANRYFNYDITTYKYQVKICKKIEEVIGKEKMQKIYLKGAPVEFIDELAEYSSWSEATKFMKKNDLLMKIQIRNSRKKNLTEEEEEEEKQLKKEILSFIENIKDKANIISNEEIHEDNTGLKL